MTAPLHVISVISNPLRFKSRPRLWTEFNARMKCAGVPHYTVELALRNSDFEVTSPDNPMQLQLRHSHEIWHKENMMNLGVQRLLPDNADNIAFIDADVMFTRPNWAEETAAQLESFKVVQMFTTAFDLGPEQEPIQQHTGFVYAWKNGVIINDKAPSGGFNYGGYHGPSNGSLSGSKHHPGYAWAWRREALDAVGGVIDYAILGSGDYHMAVGLIGEMDKSIFGGMSAGFKSKLKQWEWLAATNVREKIGYVDNTIMHYWHGKKKNRGYDDRWKILRDNQYDPSLDIITDTRGVLGLAGNKPALRDGIMGYFRSRAEDSIDVG